MLRYLLLTNTISRILTNDAVQVLLAAVSGAYFLTLDVWGADLNFVKNNIEVHQFVFSCLLLVTLLSQIMKALSTHFADRNRSSYTRFLEDFMLLTARVVEFKLDRFRKNARNLKPNSDAFKAITQPNDQIAYIISQSLESMRRSFGLNEDQLSMTIIQVKDDGARCFYAFEEPRGWNRTKAKKIMTENSAAALCASTGEHVFHADKSKAAQADVYFISGRDSKKSTGSIYCYPVNVQIPNGIERFVVSISSYGKFVCSPSDPEAIEIAQQIFREMCRRIELELTLLAMRQWKFGE